MEATFPLPENYFPPLEYSLDELAQWKRLVVRLVERTLRDEQPVFASNYDGVDTHEWKLIKTKDHMCVYQPRKQSPNDSPSVLAVGTIHGTLEDVIFGIHNTNTRDIRATRAFLNDKSLDSAVLHVFENGMENDPYRSLALKWRAVETPAGSLVRNRDGCVLEYMGISHDQVGRRYAFQVSENVEHKICPPFTAQGVIRADVHVRAIYRELDDNRVGVFFYAGYDMSGQIPKFLASRTAASVAFSIAKSVECAEAKKLTALALTDLNATLRQKARRLPRRLSIVTPTCSICCSAPTVLSSLTSRSALTECDICTALVCGRCSAHKHILSEAGQVRIHCCVQCIVAAKIHVVDPRRPLPLVSMRAWTSRGELVVDTSVRRRNDDAVVPCSQRDTISTDIEWMDTLSSSQDDVPMLSSIRSRTSVCSTREGELVRRFSGNHPSDSPPSMAWQRMRSTAEQCYHMTKEVNKIIALDAKRRVCAP